MPTRVLTVLAPLFLSPTLALAQDRPVIDVEPALAAVHAANRRFARAERAGSLDSIAATMWPDAVVLPPRQLEVTGHEAILALLTPGSSSGEASASTSGGGTVISAGGDMAVTWGMGGPRTQPYKFVTILENRAGEWKLLVNTWNSRPSPTPSEDDGGESGLAPAAEHLTVIEGAAVEAANSRFERAERSRSLDSIAGAVWSDAVILPPGRRWAIQGHEEIFAFVTPGLTPDSTKSFAPYRANLLSAAGDMAVLSGPSCWVEQGPDGPIPHRDKFVTVFEKRGGEWKVLLHLWNPLRTPDSPTRCDFD